MEVELWTTVHAHLPLSLRSPEYHSLVPWRPHDVPVKYPCLEGGIDIVPVDCIAGFIRAMMRLEKWDRARVNNVDFNTLEDYIPDWTIWFVEQCVSMLNRVAADIQVYKNNIIFTLYGCMIILLKIFEDEYSMTSQQVSELICYHGITSNNVFRLEKVVFGVVWDCPASDVDWDSDSDSD